MNGYLPEGGVWTREEREHVERKGYLYDFHNAEPERAAATVAKLMEALEDMSRYVESGGEVQNMTREFAVEILLDAREVALDARALIDSLKK